MKINKGCALAMNLMTRLTFLLFWVLILLTEYIYAQDTLPIVNLQGKWITIKDGLSQGHVHGILRDKQGFMWFSTSDGLNRYDGYEMKTFRHDPKDKYSLPDNNVLGLMEDDNGNFWLGTQNKGLFLFDRKKERFYYIGGGQDKLAVKRPGTSFPQYRNGVLLVHGVEDICLYDVSRIKPGNYEHLDMPLLFSYNQVQPLDKYKAKQGIEMSTFWAKNGEMWVIFGYDFFHFIPNKGMTKWEVCDYHLSYLSKVSIYPLDIIMLPISGKENKRILRYSTGLLIYDIEKDKIDIRLDSFGISSNILKSGEIILRKGNKRYLFNLETYTLTPYTINGNVEIDADLLVYEDKNDIIWLGTNGFGLIKCDRRLSTFNTYKINKNKRFNNLMGYDWIKGYYEKTFLDTIGFRFSQVVRDHSGAFWLYDDDSKKPKNVLTTFTPGGKLISYYFGNHEVINSMIFRDNADNIWFFCDEGGEKKMIYRFDKKTGRADVSYRFPNAPDFNVFPFISQAWQDKKGVFWFATMQGLFSLELSSVGTQTTAGKWHQWRHNPNNPSSISSDILYTLCPDPVQPDKYLWIGTAGQGFDCFEYATGKCKHYTVNDGLSNNTVYGILSDTLNNLWLSTNKGLSCFNPSAFSTGEDAFRNFNEEDGLQGDEFNRYTFLKLQNGNLMFGGVDGFVMFDPVKVLQQSAPLEMAFTGLSIANKAVDWKIDTTVISAPIPYAKTITLQPHQNIFTLSFAIFEYRGNDKKYYKYKLEGFDKDWTTKSNKNDATYTNLSPGTYTFRVKGRASDGVWNEKGISIEIIVLPAWYQTKLFYITFILLIASSLYALYRYRLAQMLRAERLRNRIAQDLHDEIGSTLSSIALYGEAAKKMTQGNVGAEKILGIINGSVSEVMESMSDIVWAINTRHDSLDDLVNRMRNFAVQGCESKNIVLDFTESVRSSTLILDMIQRKNLYLIFKEAVNNALKYSDCEHLKIDIKTAKHILCMCITDDGKGFDIGEDKKSMGGNGLKNMNARALEVGGKLKVVSELGKGTEICFELGV